MIYKDLGFVDYTQNRSNYLCLTMFVKIATVALTAFIATAAADDVWNGFSAVWSLNPSTGFFTLPKTFEAAENEGWTNVTDANPPQGLTSLGYEGDPTLILLFLNGDAIGFQIAIRAADLDPNQPLQWAENDATIVKTMNGEEYYTLSAYFYHDEATGIRKIWVQEKDGLTEIPTNESTLLESTRFLRKNCIPTMGVHYYEWESNSDCATLNPWFLMGDGNVINGLGIQGFGNLKTVGSRKWWETIPPGGVSAAMADPPACGVAGTEVFGSLSIHLWFVDKPQYVGCE